jgi:DNA-binding CsgD family transcriptional regulator
MDAVRADAAEHVVQRFFEAAALPELWPGALHDLAQACGAEGAAAHSSDGLKTFGTVGSQGLGELHDNFVKHWRAPELNSHRARGIALLKRGWRGALTEQDCFPPEELARDPFQQDFFVRSGYGSFAGIVLAKSPELTLSVSIIRRVDQGRYSRGEIDFINRLSAQLRVASAVAVRFGLESSRRISDTFGTAGHPVALIGHAGRVIHMNARFADLIGDGIQVAAGRLGSWQGRADSALAAAIDRAVRHDGTLGVPPKPVVLPRRDARPLVAHVMPVVGQVRDLLHLVAAIVTLTDLSDAATRAADAVLMEAFGLTAAEARLAVQIAAGRTLPEIARDQGVAHETLRSRLKSVFGKTGTGRQTELALLVAKLGRPSP